jgi:excisionase family DNA binding protein
MSESLGDLPATIQATYRTIELSAMFQVSKRTIWRRADAGEIPGQLRIGRSVRWSKAVVDEWIKAGCPRPRGRHSSRNAKAG